MTTRPRVLVVDDDESIRKFALRVLEDAGYEVVSVEDGPGALRLTEEAAAAVIGGDASSLIILRGAEHVLGGFA